MDWYEEEVRSLERAPRLPYAAGECVLFYGSSSVRLWSTLTTDFPDAPVVNRAFGGSTMAACARFFPRIVAPCAPGSIVLYAGDNDLGDGVNPPEVAAFLDSLLSQRNRLLGSVRLVFLSVKPSPARFAILSRIREFNALAIEVLKKHASTRYVDVHTSMLDGSDRPRPELFCEDGLHLSSEGYKLWKTLLLPYVTESTIPRSERK